MCRARRFDVSIVESHLERHLSIKLLVADDHEVVRIGLRTLFRDSTEIDVVTEATTGEEATRLAIETTPDVVLLDVRLNGDDGIKVLGRIKLEKSDLPVVMFSNYDNPTYVARSLAYQASAYVLKGDSSERLVDVIKKAAAGEYAWTREELRRVTGALATPRPQVDSAVPLTQRESEVLKQLANGLTNKEIALTLKISYETVKEHVQHILRKVGVSDRTQAAVWAVRQGLLD